MSVGSGCIGGGTCHAAERAPAMAGAAAALPARRIPALAPVLCRGSESWRALQRGSRRLYLDYSKQRITDETLRLLIELARACRVRERIAALFRGAKVNATEQRAALHIALRAPRSSHANEHIDERIVVDGRNVVPDVHAELDRMAAFSSLVRSGEWKGVTGKRIRNVINIGIGGSDLGPVMAYDALRHYSDRDMTFRFVSNIDGTDFVEAVRDLEPEETLFIDLLEDLHDVGNARQRACRPPMVPGSGRRPRRRCRSILSRSRPTRRKSSSSASMRPTCSASGIGSAAATRWTPRSACRP